MASIQTPVVESLRRALFAPRQTLPVKDRPAVVTSSARWTWEELNRLAAAAVEQFSSLRGQRVAVIHRGDGPAWAALTALDELQADVFLVNPTLNDAGQRQLAVEFRWAAIVSAVSATGGVVSTADAGGDDAVEPNFTINRCENPAAGSGQTSVTILTSGTTGRPKAVRHNWASLCRPVRQSSAAEPPVWLQTYLPNLYAGVQVSLQCLLNGGTLVCPDLDADVDQIIDLMLREQVAFASATPSYWRRLLLFGDAQKLRSVPLQQITLGGEVVDQQVLDMLKATFPQARIVHIYATSELGRCFSVADGKAGFPADWIGSHTADGVELRLQADELLVRSPNVMLGYDRLSASADVNAASAPPNSWIATGDLVRRNGDRYVFVGRRSDIINVGGNKVYPLEVEPVLRAVPGVADVRVYGTQSSLVGQLVAAQVVAAQAEEAEAVKVRVMEAAARCLAPHQRPRLIEMVERIELSGAGKIVRR